MSLCCQVNPAQKCQFCERRLCDDCRSERIRHPLYVTGDCVVSRGMEPIAPPCSSREKQIAFDGHWMTVIYDP